MTHSEIEQALGGALADAEDELDRQNEAVAKAQAEAAKIVDAAKEKRKAVLAEVIQITKSLKALRGEPMIEPRQKSEPTGEWNPGQERIDTVLQGIADFTGKEKTDKFSVSDIDKVTNGISYETIRRVFKTLRQDEVVLRAGVGKRGANTVALYKMAAK